jgi:putative component of toxin-antitoxin plasmid stabilization module
LVILNGYGFSKPFRLIQIESVDGDDKFIRKKANEMRIKFPKGFKMFFDKSGKLSEHYSPELIEYLMNFKKKETTQSTAPRRAKG